jgi:heme A synthase
MAELLGLFPDSLIDSANFAKLYSRLALDLFFTSLVVLGVYVRRYGKTEFIFTYFMFNLITFGLCFLLSKVKVDMGFALGLFAVFGILRYRTEQIRTRDLTYLFVVIGLAILNAVVNKDVSLAELLLLNGTIVLLAFTLEFTPALQRDKARSLLYDDLELLRSGDEAAVIADLSQRSGVSVKHYQIEDVDLLRDTVRLTIYSNSKK